MHSSCADPDGGGGGRGSRPPLKNHKNIGFLSNTGPDPLTNHKATKLAFNVGPSLNPRPLGLESSTLPLSQCAPFFLVCHRKVNKLSNCMQCLNAYNIEFIYVKRRQFRHFHREDKSEYVSTQFFYEMCF